MTSFPGLISGKACDESFDPLARLLSTRTRGLPVVLSKHELASNRDGCIHIRFPGFELEPLTQVYRRLDENTYRYESGGGRFAADLQVNETGFVTNYPGIWQAEAFI